MVIWAAAKSSIGRLLGGSRKYCNVAAVGGRFHPDIGGRLSVTRGVESTIFTSAGKSSTLPLLMVPPEMVTGYMGGHTTKNSTHYYNFISIEKQLDDGDHSGINKKLFMLDKKINSGPPDDAICRGSSQGWLFYIHPTTHKVGLFNPFGETPFYIPLPRSQLQCKTCETKIFRMLGKMALSSTPSPLVGDIDAVAITESGSSRYTGLVYCKLGVSAWINLKGSFKSYSDVIYFTQHKRFYAVPRKYCDQPFDIEAWDFSDPSSPKNVIIKPSHDCKSSSLVPFPSNPQGWRAKNTPLLQCGKIETNGVMKRYLVEVLGDLLLVLRTVLVEVGKDGLVKKGFLDKRINSEFGLDDDEFRTEITVGFSVYKMDWSRNKWEHVESLGDKALFVGMNHSFSVSTKDLPGVMPNSIYFTDDLDTWFHPWGYDTGVYNMEDGFIVGILPSSLEKIKQLPIWVLPNPK